MPVLDNVTTKGAKEVWSKGDLTIFEVTLDYNGQQLSAKTYSKAIAKPGWSGTVESYEKSGRNGNETFIKQPQREDSQYSPKGQYQKSTGGSGYSGGSSGTGKKEFDNFTMYLSYAKDLVVALQQTEGFDKEKFEELLQATIKGGKVLYDRRPGAEPEQAAPAKPDEIYTDGIDSAEPLDMSAIDELFPDNNPLKG